MNRRPILALLALSALHATATPSLAQTPEWPQAKPIADIVPFTAGGSTDVGGTISTHAINASLYKNLSYDPVNVGMEIVGGTPEELAALMAKEIPRWGALVKKSGATAN